MEEPVKEFGTSEMKDYLIPRREQDVSIDQIRSDNNIQIEIIGLIILLN